MFVAECAGSLEKIFATDSVIIPENGGSMLKNERYSFQVSFFSRWEFKPDCWLKIKTDLEGEISCRVVEYANGTYNLPEKHDWNYLFLGGTVRSYPDILKPFGAADLYIRPNVRTVVWITVCSVKKAGDYKIEIELHDQSDDYLCGCDYALHVIDAVLPENDIPVTQWIHFDCICDYYDVQPFTDEFYTVFNQYLKTYVAHAGNTLYTPLFTPPLNTLPGSERRTMQTVDVQMQNGHYTFQFDKLKKFIENAQSHGIEYFEFSHLATQWGAKAAPKILVKDGREEPIAAFGWHTPATGERYTAFLQDFLPALDLFLSSQGCGEKSFIHISDEPKREHFGDYKIISDLIRKYLKNCRICDAMGDYEFYGQRATDISVVALDRFSDFKNRCENVWVYYCMEQTDDHLTNRFLNMPLQRLRILGFQLYLNRIKGFLHWGFNFYYDYYSRFLVDPHNTTDACGAYPSGDAFIVYPDRVGGGVLDSVRLETFNEAINDYRSLLALERKYGQKFATDLLIDNGMRGFTVYPADALWHKRLRNDINRLIEEGSHE